MNHEFRTMKRYIFLFLALMGAMAVEAQTGTVTKIELEHGVTNSEGVSGMNIHLNFTVKGMKGVDGKAVVYFYSPKGVGVKDLNNRYCTVNGEVSCSRTFCPGYVSSDYTDFTVFIPNTELHLKAGKNTYYCQAYIWNLNTNKSIAVSTYASFVGTGTSDSQNGNSNGNGSNVAKRFPDKQTFYFTNARRSGLAETAFYYDDRNDPVCKVSAGLSTGHYKWESNSSNALEFTSFIYQPETRSVPVIYGPFPRVEYTGKNIKVKVSGSRFSLRADYNYLTLNGNVYNVRIGESEYHKLWNQLYGNQASPRVSSPQSSGGGYSGGSGSYGSSGSGSSSSSQSTICKYCRGTGNCSSCNGKGYKFNSYSGHDDTCPSCNGKGRCFNCYGSGRQR